MRVNELRTEVATVMADVLVHQRARWGAVLEHQRQFEGWWKAEMTLALASWTWRADRLSPPLFVSTECKPSVFDVAGGPPSADILVAPIDPASPDLGFDKRAKPRVWIELKERATWWGKMPGEASKAFGGLWSDLEKWKHVTGEGEIVLVGQITAHDGGYDKSKHLPQTWIDELDAIAAQYKRAIDPPRCVGYELKGEDAVRWARFDCFVVNHGE